MKTKFIFCAAIALLAVSCTKEQPIQQEQTAVGLTVTASVEQPGSKTSLDGLNVKWTVGDQIKIYDENGNNAIYQAKSAATTTSFEYVSGDTDLSGDVYAYYPADKVTAFNTSSKAFTATLPASQAYNASGFADGINPMTAKATIADGGVVLSFKNVLSLVKVQITDSESNKTLTGISLTSATTNLCGTATVTVGDNGVATTAISGDAKIIELSGVNQMLSTVAFPIYVAVPAGNLGNITITAMTSETDGDYSQTKTSTSALTATRSNIYSYNPMAISGFSGKTSIAQAAANCYMVNSSMNTIIIPLSQAIAGWTAIKGLEPSTDLDAMTVKINSGTERTIAVRWLNGTGTITLKTISSKTMTLDVSKCSAGSNAVVDLKNEGEIVWSWHLWFTDYVPGADNEHTTAGQVHTYSGPAFQEGGKYYGKVMMDRNLGATATGVSKVDGISQPTTDDVAKTLWGFHYQFGRKEPFSLSVEPTKVDVTTDKVTYAYAAQHPEEFYYSSTGCSWSSTDDARTDANMTDPWNSKSDEKSAFDPCPAGWRVPVNGTTASSNVWEGITIDTWKSAISSTSKTAGQLWCGAWIPSAAYRHYYHGYLYGQGNNCCFWGAPANATSGYCGWFYSGLASTTYNPSPRSYGLSIRCVKL